ncbi:MAG: hypothetical protein VYA95_04575, partial [Candidatus Thermoplasmatota archaeon]|nr:hypothetical protein [Candidatus Thermoplasmatota archaeon]
MSDVKDDSETNKFMQAQENSHDEKTNDAIKELGELMENVNLYQKATVSNEENTENQNDNLKDSPDKNLEIGGSKWNISQFNKEINGKIARLQDKIDDIDTIIMSTSPDRKGVINISKEASEVDSLSKEAKQEI